MYRFTVRSRYDDKVESYIFSCDEIPLIDWRCQKGTYDKVIEHMESMISSVLKQSPNDISDKFDTNVSEIEYELIKVRD